MKQTTNDSKESPTFIPSAKQNPGPTQMDYPEMNEQDAKISGYTDRKGQAVDMAKKNVKGSPTGAYTDIGAGRSSVVKDHKTVEDAPKPREEQAP